MLDRFLSAYHRLARKRGFVLASLVTLALGVGGSTGLFSLVHGVLLRPLPYHDPAALHHFHWKSRENASYASSADHFLFWRQRSRAFAAIAAYELQSSGATLLGGDAPAYVHSLRVSHEFFPTLGVTPAYGRGFVAAEDQPGGPRAVILTHRLRQRHFGGERAILGKLLQLGDQRYTVVGILPPGFQFQPDADVLIPLQASAQRGNPANLYGMIGRLARGTTREQALSEARVLAAVWQRERTAAGGEPLEARLEDYRTWLTRDVRRQLLFLFGASVLVLALCCINLAHLFLARAASQAGETATRIALGAGWPALLGQSLSESTWIAVPAALAGWGLANLLVPAALALSPGSLPRAAEVEVGWVELAFAACVAGITLLLIGGLQTAWAVRQEDRNGVRGLLWGGHAAQPGPSQRMGLAWLPVIGEVALSFAVLVVTLLLITVFWRQRSVNPGFTADRVVAFQVPLQAARFRSPQAAWSFAEGLAERFQEIPGVESTAVATNLPLEQGLNVPLHVDGHADNAVEYRAISPDYFRCLRIPLFKGRSFTPSDGLTATPVAIVNETLARRYWPDRQAIGQTVWVAKGLGTLADRPRQIVGIVQDIREIGLGLPPEPTLYIPQAQIGAGLWEVVQQSFPLAGLVRFARPEKPAFSAVRQAVREVDSHQALASLRALAEVVAASLARERFYAVLAVISGALALALTALGIYGVLHFQMSQRTREIGLRRALGAQDRAVLALVLAQSLRCSLLGIGCGVILALWLTRSLGALVDGVGSYRDLTFLWVALLLLALALAASYLPTRKALRARPLDALKAP